MILLLGGTSETAPLAEALANAGYRVLVSTATDIPLDVGSQPNIAQRRGPLSEPEMAALVHEQQIKAIVDAAHPAGAIVKVIFENAYLTDEQKVTACHLAEEAGADFVKTSTGFAPTGATVEDIRLMRRSVGPQMQVKAAHGVRTLDAALQMIDAGVTRMGATATAAILDDFAKLNP